MRAIRPRFARVGHVVDPATMAALEVGPPQRVIKARYQTCTISKPGRHYKRSLVTGPGGLSSGRREFKLFGKQQGRPDGAGTGALIFAGAEGGPQP